MLEMDNDTFEAMVARRTARAISKYTAMNGSEPTPYRAKMLRLSVTRGERGVWDKQRPKWLDGTRMLDIRRHPEFLENSRYGGLGIVEMERERKERDTRDRGTKICSTVQRNNYCNNTPEEPAPPIILIGEDKDSSRQRSLLEWREFIYSGTWTAVRHRSSL